MAAKFAFDSVSQVAAGIWEGQLSWAENKMLGTPLQEVGFPTVIMVCGPEYDTTRRELRFPIDRISILNAGQGDRTIFVSEDGSLEAVLETRRHDETFVSAGDQSFLLALGVLPENVQRAGKDILGQIRQRFKGDLKPYPRRRFFESPDNFWGVEIQTRLQMLKFTVRGKPDRFGSSSLKIWLDRPPVYSAFKISSSKDVDEAVRIIGLADRKR